MSYVGGPPQDLTYNNEVTTAVVGDNNHFREFCTVNLGTAKGKGTSVGSNNYFMSYTHLGHDVHVHNNVVVANDTHIAGHVILEDNVKVMGVCACNQHVRVGKFAFMAGGSVVNKDIMPFTQAQGNFAISRATNKIGLQRSGYSDSRISNIHKAVRLVLMGSNTMDEAMQRMRDECEVNEDIEYMISFIQESKRGIGR